MARMASAGDVDYETWGSEYATRRRPDPRIAARILAALGGARTVLNVGAGTGSYDIRGVPPLSASRPCGPGPWPAQPPARGVRAP